MNTSTNMARKLPEYAIGGTVFTVDARIYEFRETAEPWNNISMKDFWEESPTHILFDKQSRNIYTGATQISDKPANVEIIVVPPLTQLDPIGLARHYNMADDTFLSKVNPNAVFQKDPEFMIGGTLFTYHKLLNEFMQRDVPSNRIQMEGVWEDNLWTQFFFDSKTKNIYTGGFPDGERPRHVQLVIMPSLPHCERMGIHVKSYHEKQATLKNESKQPLPVLAQTEKKHKKGRRV